MKWKGQLRFCVFISRIVFVSVKAVDHACEAYIFSCRFSLCFAGRERVVVVVNP